MPHTPTEKKRVLARVKRIKGQLDGIERALDEDADCHSVLQQIAAIRGAVTGLMRQVLESHIRETFAADTDDLEALAQVEELNDIIKSYLK